MEGFASLRLRAGTSPASSAVAVDTLVAVLCSLATVVRPAMERATTGWSLFVLAALAGLPLICRRRYPIAVTAVVGAATVGLAVTGAMGYIPLAYGYLVAFYTVAALGSRPWRWLTVVGTAASVIVVVLLVFEQKPAALSTSALPYVAAYALGTAARARRDRIAMMEERTLRVARERDVAAARERERIAREIHDIVAHSVSVMVVQAEAGAVVVADPGKATAAFDSISTAGREAVNQLSRALGVLRRDGPTRRPPPALDDLPALVGQARLTGLDASLSEHGRPRSVPADLAATVYRVVQEAVTNTIKHAHARQVAVRLDWRDEVLRLEVTDDGQGVPASGGGLGQGLVGMRERIEALGGHLGTGVGEDGVGFRILAVLPTGPTSGGRRSADG